MKCKNCKHCKQIVAATALSYQCLKNSDIVGNYDIASKRAGWCGPKTCKDFVKKPAKKVIFASHEYNPHNFTLENRQYRVRGGDKETNQTRDTTWVTISNKITNMACLVYWEDIDYIGTMTDELEDRIISLCLLTK